MGLAFDVVNEVSEFSLGVLIEVGGVSREKERSSQTAGASEVVVKDHFGRCFGVNAARDRIG